MPIPMMTPAVEATPTVLLRNIASGKIASSPIRHSCQRKATPAAMPPAMHVR
jgi:hypothetical protein